ncbi:MAG: EthD family reductase [Anaerolineae bacterium]|nr:EthD family reductase [Anaerolineae bacterium]
MVKLTILFKHPADEAAFEEAYSANLHLLEALPGIIRRQANMVQGGPRGKSSYYRILELYFQDFAALDAALTSEAGQAAGRALMSFAGDVVELLFVDVFEAWNP